MNADLKRVRGEGSDELSPSAKRRALSLHASPPPSDTVGDGMEEWQKVVETKRKEAIYRQMLEYRRMYSREQRRASELEAQTKVLEASMQAVEICWSQLVSAIQDLVGPADLGTDVASDEPPLEAGSAGPQLEKALQARLPKTRQMVKNFVDMTTKNGVSPAIGDLHSKCGKLQAESQTLRTTNQSLQAQITGLTDSRETLQRDLQKAQKSLDRQRMEHSKAEESWKERDKDRERDKGSATPGPRGANGSGRVTPNGVEEKPAANGSTGMGQLLDDTVDMEGKAESRLKALEALRADYTALQQEHDLLKATSGQPSEAALRDSSWFQIYLQQLSTHANRANDLQSRLEASERKLDELRSHNLEFKESILAESKAEGDALRQQITLKNQDLTRLRGQRDEMNAELLERRSREAEKMRFAEEVEVLAKAREDRIGYLIGEVKLLRSAAAARDGSSGYLGWLKREEGVDGDYIKDLEAKYRETQIRLEAYISEQQEAKPVNGDVKEEEAACDVGTVKADLEVTKAALDKYERVFGPNPSVAEDVKELAQKLRHAEEERERLQLELSTAEDATNALYSEVENLSELWQGLETTMKSRVYELKDGELKINRLATEKAKANNKYFAAMQSKETLENEVRAIQRTVEKQLLLLQKSQETEKLLNGHISAHEKGLTALKNASMDLQKQLAQATTDKFLLEAKLSQTQASLADAHKVMHQRVADHASEKSAREKAEEDLASSQAKYKKLKERQDAAAASGGTHTALELEAVAERNKLQAILRCSCCQQGFKQQVITRCFHTFCKDCLDARIASRQRKCPACGVAFSKEEVQTLYWQ